VQDALLDQLGAERREQIIHMIVAYSEPTTPPSRVMASFQRLEGDKVRELRQELVRAAGGENEMRAALARKGQTLAEWEAGLKREFFRREVLYSALGNVVDSPAAAKAYYDAHPEKFRRDDAWQLRRIRIPKSKFSTPQAAAEAAALIHRKLTEGHDFAALAANLAYDPPYGAQGGMLTVKGVTGLASGNFPAEERLARNLKDGEISAPLDMGDAFLIVRREAYRAAVTPTFEEAANQAAALAYSERVRKKKEEFFEKQRKNAFVEVLLPDPPARLLQ
jgi:parvulin-like peptidyl-prolyl isomerase